MSALLEPAEESNHEACAAADGDDGSSPQPNPSTAAAVEQALAAACTFALESLNASEVLSLLRRHTEPVETIGHITSLHEEFFICSSCQGDVFVPKHLLPPTTDDLAVCEGTSWILTMLPSLRRRTQWRAVTAAQNNEGWQSAGRARKGPKSRGARESCRPPPRYLTTCRARPDAPLAGPRTAATAEAAARTRAMPRRPS